MTKQCEAVVVLDGGHGLPDPGAVGCGLEEHSEVLKIVNAVASKLPSSIKVIYTRTMDKAISPDKGTDLNARCNIANQNKADLFVSFHLNASGTGKASGYETLVYSPNKAGSIVHAEIQGVLKKYCVPDRGIKSRKDVRVLNGTNMPALLLECLFIDCKADMDKLQDKVFFEELAQAIADGICKVVGVAPKQKEEVATVADKTNEKADAFAQEAQEWVKEKGISDGFNPRDPITRQEVWVMLQRLYEKVTKR